MPRRLAPLVPPHVVAHLVVEHAVPRASMQNIVHDVVCKHALPRAGQIKHVRARPNPYGLAAVRQPHRRREVRGEHVVKRIVPHAVPTYRRHVGQDNDVGIAFAYRRKERRVFHLCLRGQHEQIVGSERSERGVELHPGAKKIIRRTQSWCSGRGWRSKESGRRKHHECKRKRCR